VESGSAEEIFLHIRKPPAPVRRAEGIWRSRALGRRWETLRGVGRRVDEQSLMIEKIDGRGTGLFI